MKALRLTLILSITIVAALASWSGYAYASMDDKSDRLSSNQSSVFSPGYVNASMQKTREIIRQVNQGTYCPNEQAMEEADSRIANEVQRQAVEKPSPDLKKKSGGSGEVKSKQETSTSKITVIEGEGTYLYVNHDIAIGTGTEQERNDAGQLLAEKIDGVRYVYAGFGGYSLQDAINNASGTDIVAVKEGTYNGISVDHSITIRGGYDEHGNWHNTRYEHGEGEMKELDRYRYADRMQNTGEHETRIGGSAFYTGADNASLVIEGVTFDSAFGGEYMNHVCWSCMDIYGWSSVRISNSNFLAADAGIYSFGGARDILIENSYFNCSFGISPSGGWEFNGDDWTCWNANVTIGNSTFEIFNGILAYNNVNVILENNNFYGCVPYGSVAWANDVLITGSGNYRYGGGDFGPAPTIMTSEADKANKYNYNPPSTITVPVSLPSNMFNPNDNPYLSNANHDSTTIGNSLLFGGMGMGLGADMPLSNTLAAENAPGMAIMYGELSGKPWEDPLGRYALAVSLTSSDGMPIEDRIALLSIIKNPNEDQKLILDAIMALMQDVNKQEKESSSPEALKKASDDLLQVVANILIAQAIPDLFKESDIASIKDTFQELNTQKARIITEYNLSVDPYYKEVKKLLAKNLALLQLNNIVSKTMVEDELRKLEPNDIDKLIEKLRKLSDKSINDSILNEESKLKTQYLDPGKKLFEDRMKAMLESFTQRLSKILEEKRGR